MTRARTRSRRRTSRHRGHEDAPEDLGAAVELLYRLAAPQRCLQIRYALRDRDFDGLHVLPEQQDRVDAVLGAARDGWMKHRDPRDARPIPAPHRGSNLGADQFRRQHALDECGAGLECLEGRMVVTEACAMCLNEEVHESRKRDTELIRAGIKLDDGEAKCLAFATVSRPPLKSLGRSGPSSGNWKPCAAASNAFDGYVTSPWAMRKRRDGWKPYLSRNSSSPI